MKKLQDASKAFAELIEPIQALRDPETGCPWDLEQTHSSLKQYLIEEAYELIDAIDHQPDSISEELGDVLLQVLLHSQIAADEGTFSITEVMRGLNEKLIERHPHVFGNTSCQDAAAVEKTWEESKQQSKKGLLDGLPRGLPALQKAHLIGQRTERVGFDWSEPALVAQKVEEEVQEYLEALESKTEAEQEEEFGDLLFTLAQLGRKQSMNTEEILQKACGKFTERFKKMETSTETPLAQLSDDELQALWTKVKEEK